MKPIKMGVLFLSLLCCSFGCATKPAEVNDKEFYIGADISAAATLEKAGAVYRENNEPADLFTILKDNGFNTIRLRIFVNPNNQGIVTNSLPYTLELAKRTKAHNMKLLLNFHYSDTWADPQKQYKPAAWEKMSFDELKQTMQDYTASVIATFKKEGVLPDMVQVGNEITPGMLWPDGRVGGNFENDAQWDKFTSLLKAGIAGVRQGAGGSKVIIMLHIDQGGKKGVTKWFFDNINKRNVPYDVIGVSYYPWWHGKIEDLNDNLNYIATELKKDVIVVESGYPYAANDRMKSSENQQYPTTPQGQYDMLYTVTKTVLNTPDNHGRGVFYWFPESVPIPGRPGRGGLGLFDPNGNVLPGAKAFSDAFRENAKQNKK